MKRFSERNPIIIGAVSIAVIAALVLFGLTYDKLPFLGGERTYSAYFADAAALRTGADVEVSGSKVGKVTAVSLDGSKARVEFTVSRDISLGTVPRLPSRPRRCWGQRLWPSLLAVRAPWPPLFPWSARLLRTFCPPRSAI